MSKSYNKIRDILKAPYSMTLDITNKCNFRCIHCYNCSGENFTIEDELSDEEILNVINEIASIGLDSFCFCGGEPLLRKELLIKCAKILSKGRVSSIGVVTNGFLVDENVAKELYESGITSAQVSLDGSTFDTYERIRGVKGSFNRAVNALKMLKKAEIEQVSSAFCPTSFNCEQLEEVYNICCESGIDILRVQPLMLIGRATDNLHIKPSDFQYRKLVSCVNKLKKNSGSVLIDWSDPIQHLIKYRNISENTSPIISIRANGSITNSPYLPITLGNIRRHTLSEYWKAGLGLSWNLDIVKTLAKNINCIDDMGATHENVPVAWKDKDIEIDIIDDLDYRIDKIKECS